MLPTVVTQNITIQLNASGAATITPAQINYGSSDNCSIANYSLDKTSFSCENVGQNTVKLTVTDKNGNSKTGTATVTVQDITKPIAICKSIDVYLGLNGTVSILPTDVNYGSNDACTVRLSINKSSFNTSNIGANNVVLTATDPSGNSASCTAVVTVKKRPTTLMYTGDGSAQYSDQQVLTATLIDQLTNTALGGKTISFAIGTQSTTAVTNASGVATTTLVITQNPAPAYFVATSFAGDGSFVASSDNDAFDITQEDALVEYTGSEFASTGTATATTATIRLNAKITDAADVYRGDIRNATVNFIITPYDCNSMAPGAPITLIGSAVTLMNALDKTVGTSFKDYTFDIGSCNAKIFDVQIKVGNYYLGETVATVSVAKSLNDFITGGGHLNFCAGTANTSCGTLKSDDGSKTNFGFNVKYNKTGTNLQGNVNIIFRSASKVYQAKGTVGGSNGILSVNVSDPANKMAVLTAKASITNTATGLVIPDGIGASMEMRISDKGEPGVNDTYTIKIWGASGALLYGSSCSGADIKIDGGNIQVSSTIIGLPTTTTLVSSLNPSNTGNPVTFTATVSRGSSTAIPLGIVTFKDGTTTLGTRTIALVGTAYKATFTTSSLTAGSHSITAVYSGNASFNSSTSAILTQKVISAIARANTSVIAAPKAALTVATSQALMLKAYPNPTTSYFNLTITGSINNPVTVRVLDARGKVIQLVQKIALPSTLRLGDNWTNGLYIFEVIQGREIKMVKVVKAN